MTDRRQTVFSVAFLAVAFLGFLDAAYLAVEHYRGVVPPCTIVEGCEKVTTSPYALVFGVPIALAGALYYLSVVALALFYLDRRKDRALKIIAWVTPLGFLASLWFLYVQIFILDAICIYCVFSAATSTALFVLGIFSLGPISRPATKGP